MYLVFLTLLLAVTNSHILTADFGVQGKFAMDPHIVQFDLSKNPITVVSSTVVPNDINFNRAGYYRGAYDAVAKLFYFYYNYNGAGQPGTLAFYNITTKVITPAIITPSEFTGFIDIETDSVLNVAILGCGSDSGNISYWIFDPKTNVISYKTSILLPNVQGVLQISVDSTNHIVYHPLVALGKEELIGYVQANIMTGDIKFVKLVSDRFFDSASYNPTGKNLVGLLWPPEDAPDNNSNLGILDPFGVTIKSIGQPEPIFATFNESPGTVSPDGTLYAVISTKSNLPDIELMTYDVNTGVRSENPLPPLTGSPNFPWSFVQLT